MKKKSDNKVAILKELTTRSERSSRRKVEAVTPIEIKINRQTLVDLTASYLHAIKAVNKEISNIQFGELFGVSDQEFIPLKITVKEV